MIVRDRSTYAPGTEHALALERDRFCIYMAQDRSRVVVPSWREVRPATGDDDRSSRPALRRAGALWLRRRLCRRPTDRARLLAIMLALLDRGVGVPVFAWRVATGANVRAAAAAAATVATEMRRGEVATVCNAGFLRVLDK